MKFSVLAVAFAAVVMISQPAHAVLITRNAGLDNLGTAATISAVTIDNTPGSESINISMSVLELGNPFRVGFSVDESAFLGPLPTVTPYTVNVTLTNAIVRPGVATGRPINGFDVNVNPAPAGSPFISLNTPPSGPLPTSDTFGVENPNIGTGFRFGGLNGGGGELYFGQTAISTFELSAISTGNGLRNFALDFTANPEPASLLLAGLLLGPAGIVANRRRRKREADMIVEAVAV